MKFSVATLVAFAVMALAYPNIRKLPSPPVDSQEAILTLSPDPIEKRQNVPVVDASVPAMTDRFGNVIPFDATRVYQDAKDSGI
jgi:hypothetical protein